ncbi:hypothetical protein [Streptomyces chartreusis]|uniref:hypothetical protein n=1 Tax=Streptomyces chartreusis TaxID=1969 RepID=UPI003650CC7E
MADSTRVEEYLADVRTRQQRVWPTSMPSEAVHPLGQRPLTDQLRHGARRHPDRIAITFYDEQITYAALEDLTARLCALHHLGRTKEMIKVSGMSVFPYKGLVVRCVGVLPMATTGKVKKGELEQAARIDASPAAADAYRKDR